MKSALLWTIALLLCLVPAGAPSALSVQEALLIAKPGVALVTTTVRAEVTLDCGQGPVTVSPAPFVETGTAWFVDGRGYLITNGHVVDPAYRTPAWVSHELKQKAIDQGCVDPLLRERGLSRGQRPELEDRIRRSASDRAMAAAKVALKPELGVLLSNGTRLIAKVERFSAPLSLDATGQPLPDSGRDLALLRVKDGVYPALALSTRAVQIGDPVHILGFPGVVLSHELLNQSATLDASVTNGEVSGLKQDAIGQDVIQTDAPAAHGNSGGPAVTNDATVVGVMTFVSLSSSGGEVQGFNFLIPARDVRNFLKGTDVATKGRNAFDTAWRAGLDAFFTEDYRKATARLREANALVPNLPDVKRALGEAEEKLRNPPPRPFPWAWTTLGVSLVSVGAYGAMFARRWWKNRFRILPTQVISAIEHGAAPVILDVRTKTDYETSPLRLPAALRLDPADAEAGRLDLLDIDPRQMIVTYDTTPEEATSVRVAQLLRQRGFRNVRILKGGLGGWTNARLPVEAKSHLPSIGLEIYKNLTLGDVERRRFKAGEAICHEGDDPHGEAYVVHSGAVRITRKIDGAEHVLNRLGEGELFGEMALFRKAPRSADAVAETETEVLVLKNERLEWLIRNRPALTLEVLKRLSNIVAGQSGRERAEPA